MVSRDVAVRSIFHSAGVPVEIVDYVESNNPSNSVPYHGFQHLLVVVKNVDALLSRLGDVPHDVRKALLIAALVHDADYVVGVSDEVNVPRAVRWFDDHISLMLSNEWGLVLGERVAELVRFYIQATSFPHSSVAVDPWVAVIRDADLQNVEPDRELFLEWLRIEKDGVGVDESFPPDSLLTYPRLV